MPIGTIIQFAIMYGPEAYKKLVELFHKPNPTKEDFLALIDESASKSYDDYIAAARVAAGQSPLLLPAGGPVPTV
ncbi:MAG: hypothetical protein M3167_06265 [Acidobacteriota bacterium]|nr:hypothetical protein [Acidobacteriota bacterium]MDQ6892268.1 hypothetical protein [Acidobacteriota bacterium]